MLHIKYKRNAITRFHRDFNINNNNPNEMRQRNNASSNWLNEFERQSAAVLGKMMIINLFTFVALSM